MKKKESSPKISLFAKPDDMTLEQWQIALRVQMAKKEQFTIDKADNCYGEYIVKNAKSDNQYKVVFKGTDSQWNFCSCMDFKTSQLGTCKHIEAVRLRYPKAVNEFPPYSSVYISYTGTKREVKIRIGDNQKELIYAIANKYFTLQNTLRSNAYMTFDQFIRETKEANVDVRIYQDALDYIVECRGKIKRQQIIEKRYSTNEDLDGLLKNAKLYPYQREGVKFAFSEGKSIIADEMGLGKTIQGICTAELFRKEGLVQNILVICPTSLKYQWKREIEKFTSAEVLVIEGNHLKRVKLYQNEQPYKIVSYNSLCNDIKIDGQFSVDLVLMDEVQRLKNWNTQIAKAMRKITSDYSVILSGTPLENKLEELYSIVQLADQFVLGPYYKFRSEHINTDENGKTIGYKKLNSIKEDLRDVLIRRSKSEVKLQLPSRIDKNLIVPITKEQFEMHEEYKAIVAKLVNKWKKMKFLSESDRKKLLLSLSCMRMLCDSTYILDQETRFDTKVDEIINIISEIIDTTDEKVVVFSQWERMTRIIAQELDKHSIQYENLHGGVPSVRRKVLIDEFTDNPEKRVFLSTDAGSTGLNLQVASVIINVDLPWNPAVLEQRIARIWRIGQKNNIQVINLIAEGTIEASMVGKLNFKYAMAQGVLDGGEDTIFMDDDKFKAIVETIGAFLSETPEISNEEAFEITEEKRGIKEETGRSDNDNDSETTELSNPVESESFNGFTAENTQAIKKGVDFMEKMGALLNSKSVCNMLIGAMAMDDPEHIQDHIASLEENKKNITDLINLFKALTDNK